MNGLSGVLSDQMSLGASLCVPAEIVEVIEKLPEGFWYAEVIDLYVEADIDGQETLQISRKNTYQPDIIAIYAMDPSAASKAGSITGLLWTGRTLGTTQYCAVSAVPTPTGFPEMHIEPLQSMIQLRATNVTIKNLGAVRWRRGRYKIVTIKLT